MSQEAQVIRIACDPINQPSPIDVYRSVSINLIRGASVRFELGLFKDGVLDSIGNVVNLTLEVRLTRTGTPQMAKDVTTFTSSLTAEQWAAGTHQHALFEFTPEETAVFNMNGSNVLTGVWLIVRALTATGKKPFWIFGQISVEEIGMGTTGAPPAGDPQYYTKAEVDAIIAAILNGTTGFETIRLYNQDTAAFHLGRLAGQNKQVVVGWSDSL